MFYPAEGMNGGASVSMLLPIVMVLCGFYFLIMRPQSKRQKERNLMLGSLKIGDKVTTIGGLHGTIIQTTDRLVVLEVNHTTELTFERNAINNIVLPETQRS